jgi:hypothetical protein
LVNAVHLLRGAIDLHVHAAPDIVARADDLFALSLTARSSGMAALVIKDHNTSTVGRADALNRLAGGITRFVGGIALNPAVGGLNPIAVEAALRAGAAIVWMPTFGARHHVSRFGRGGPCLVPPAPWPGVSIRGDEDEVLAILDLIARHDAILATGHLAPDEIHRLLAVAAARGVRRRLVTHANEAVPGMTVEDQRQASAAGAWIEYSLLGCTDCCPGHRPIAEFASELRQVGLDRVVVSSDFGQPVNGPAVAAFARHLDLLHGQGFSDEEIRRLIADQPRRLLDGANGVVLG